MVASEKIIQKANSRKVSIFHGKDGHVLEASHVAGIQQFLVNISKIKQLFFQMILIFYQFSTKIEFITLLLYILGKETCWIHRCLVAIWRWWLDLIDPLYTDNEKTIPWLCSPYIHSCKRCWQGSWREGVSKLFSYSFKGLYFRKKIVFWHDDNIDVY